MRKLQFLAQVLAGLTIGLTVWATVAPARATTVIRAGSELDYPPFAMVTADGEAAGFSVELMRAVADAANLEVGFRVGPWSEILAALRAGELDALPFVAITPARAGTLAFSVPYVTTYGAVFVRAEGPAIAGPADLAGRRIAVMQDDVAHDYVRRQDWGAGIVAVPDLATAFRQLAAGRHHAVVAPRLQGLLLLQDAGIEAVMPLDADLPDFRLDYAFAVKRGNDELLAELNGGLALVMADGTYDRIYQAWLPSQSPAGVPRETVMMAALGALATFLLVLAAMYWRQRRLVAAVTARGNELARLAERLEQARRAAEKAYAEERALLRVLPDRMFRLDPEGRYIDWHTPEGAAVPQDERLRGKRIDEVLPADIAEAAMAAFRRATETGSVETFEYVLPGPTGRSVALEAKIAPIPDGGALAVVRDVTIARDRETRLARAADAVAEASAAKSRFLAAMSHELRTPLNAIIGFSDLMRQEIYGAVQPAKYAQYVEDIHQSGSDLLALINNVLDLSKIEAGKAPLREEPLDLAEIIAQRVRILRPLAEDQGTRLRVDLPPGLPRLLADQLQVQQMLLNLLSNAIKFTSDGEVRTAAGPDSRGGLTITISDTGIGMTEEQLAHLGEPFYQANVGLARTAGGTGLGIALVTEMVAAHGGDIRFESEPGIGTRVILRFPPERVLTDDAWPAERVYASGGAFRR
ncbi:MAG: transporter substrate-binding domain-containing protein [Alphaproteobacteria bacterium]|jgi:signal transduction histidine kinase/ABC-type amino acid transport substrate-binding protein|nr:transporter substrate-binding domain-containing protein [Alphaproteobacteria bacterium]